MATLASRLSDLATRLTTEFNAHKARLLPAGGTTGQALRKTSATNYAAGWSSDVFEAALSISGKPGGGARVVVFKTSRAFALPASLTGSQTLARTPATASAVFSIRKNGTEFATCTFAASGSTGAFSASAATSFAAGDTLEIFAPSSQDSSLADISITLNGTR